MENKKFKNISSKYLLEENYVKVKDRIANENMIIFSWKIFLIKISLGGEFMMENVQLCLCVSGMKIPRGK